MADRKRDAAAGPQKTREVRCEITLDLGTPVAARVVSASILVDNEGWIEQSVKGTSIRARARAETLSSLRRTVDDWLAAASVAAKAHGIAGRSPPDEEE